MNRANHEIVSENAPRLGSVIEKVNLKQRIELWKIPVTGLFMATFAGAIAYSGMQVSLRDSAWLSLVLFTLGTSITVAQRLFGRTDYPILKVLENGISIVKSGESTEIHYNLLSEITCKKTSYESPGDYFEFELNSFSKGDNQKISWTSSSNSALDYDALHLRISEKVAENMAAKLKQDHRVPWANSTFICENGIEFSVKKGANSSAARTVPWSELRDMKFSDAKLLLYFDGDSREVKISCNEPNLLAGYLLVDQLMKSRFGDWMASRQTAEQVALAITDRVVPPGIY